MKMVNSSAESCLDTSQSRHQDQERLKYSGSANAQSPDQTSRSYLREQKGRECPVYIFCKDRRL